ncbi:MAG: zinc ribbon domain-containing protein [Ruminococcus flavefaciens]|nr:zinc ribbon domain-containing protein [Ruminococcus flavefaciens]
MWILSVEKVRCIYCNKKIEKNLEFCNKCGRDIRSMWATQPVSKPTVKPVALFCPNPRCHAPYIEGAVFCIQCTNDYGTHPPIKESDFYKENLKSECVYCPECGALNNSNDLFCDCGCDFRLKPKVISPPKEKRIFYCSLCNLKEVSGPDELCDNCKQKSADEYNFCPECKVNRVQKYGDICIECLSKRPMKGTGVGFHLPK